MLMRKGICALIASLLIVQAPFVFTANASSQERGTQSTGNEKLAVQAMETTPTPAATICFTTNPATSSPTPKPTYNGHYELKYEAKPAVDITSTSATISFSITLDKVGLVDPNLLTPDIDVKFTCYGDKTVLTKEEFVYNYPCNRTFVFTGLTPNTTYSYYIAFNYSNKVLASEKFTTLPAPAFTYGDIDGDGEVTSTDYAILKRYLIGIMVDFDNDASRMAADVDKSGTIDSLDYAIIKRYLIGIITELPYLKNSVTSAPYNTDHCVLPPAPTPYTTTSPQVSVTPTPTQNSYGPTYSPAPII